MGRDGFFWRHATTGWITVILLGAGVLLTAMGAREVMLNMQEGDIQRGNMTKARIWTSVGMIGEMCFSMSIVFLLYLMASALFTPAS